MHPIDFRNETFAQLQERLTGLRARVYAAWLAHGPATTRACATLSGIDLLTFRPRTTELYQMGAIRLVSTYESCCPQDGSEGVYMAHTEEEWRAWRDEHAFGISRQQQLL